MPSVKFYVVFVGRKVGIFPVWSDVEPLVKGYKGPKHMSFRSMDEAALALDSYLTGGELPEQLQG